MIKKILIFLQENMIKKILIVLEKVFLLSKKFLKTIKQLAKYINEKSMIFYLDMELEKASGRPGYKESIVITTLLKFFFLYFIQLRQVLKIQDPTVLFYVLSPFFLLFFHIRSYIEYLYALPGVTKIFFIKKFTILQLKIIEILRYIMENSKFCDDYYSNLTSYIKFLNQQEINLYSITFDMYFFMFMFTLLISFGVIIYIVFCLDLKYRNFLIKLFDIFFFISCIIIFCAIIF